MRVHPAIGISALLAVCTAQGAAPRKLIPPPVATTTGASTITVGSLTLTQCGIAYCGTIPRPLDPAGQVPGTIAISFQYFPQTDPTLPMAGALVATEGGPGYSTTGSRAYYLGLFQPIRAQRPLLLMDNRGTGGSAPFTCVPLQFQPQYTQAGIQSCGAQLGDTADLYGTGLAADDLAALIQALNLPPVDLYGDSYGSFFSQAFVARHPSLLHSVVLDSTWPVMGESPWYPEAPPAAQNAFNQACARSVNCQTLPGSSMSRIDTLLDSVRTNPVTAIAYDGDGHPAQVTADAQGLAYVMFSNASGPVVYRELDAAARAWTTNGDQAPFLRLIAENQESAHPVQGSADVAEFSSGSFVAVSCTDYPQTYSMTSPLSARAAQNTAAIAAEQQQDPTVFAPFTIGEFLQMPLDYSVINLCLTWPVPSPAHPPGQPVPPGTIFPSTPVLVLSGDLDSLTPAAQGAEAAALFPNARQIILYNSFHVTAEADPYHCASNFVRNFVQTLSPGDTSCASQIPEVHLVPQFALTASALAAPTALEGNQGSTLDLQVAEAAAYTFGDAMARFWVNTSGSGVGLRGGTFSYGYPAGQVALTLTGMKWTEDVTVSGKAIWNLSSGDVQANLDVTGPSGSSGTLTLTYSTWASGATASLTGTLNGHAIAASMYAP